MTKTGPIRPKGPVEEVDRLATRLSGETGVPVAEVVKVLGALGVSEGIQKRCANAVRQVELGRLRQAVRDAVVQVMC